jgi:predicted protein tyrosine phosphatase
MPESPTTRIPWRTRLSFFGLGCLVGLILGVSLEAADILLGSNCHVLTIAPGRIYRCAQPSGASLEQMVRTYGIRTVLNLRGNGEPAHWYREESLAASRLGISMEDLSLSASRLPSPPVLRELVELLDHSAYPILVHCHRGIDRTGLASTVAVLLHTDTPLDTAVAQLGFRYGHLPLGRTESMDRFFELYREWLADQGQPHSCQRFRHWITSEYCPGECRATVEPLDPVGDVLRLPRGKPSALRVRCHNTSVKPWSFRPGDNAGVHAYFVFLDSDNRWAAFGRAGLFYAEVPPGQSIDLTLSLPALPPGRYELRVDLSDEQHAFFFQTGSEPLLLKVEVP